MIDKLSDTMILLDSNALCHKAKHTMKELSYEEKKVGVMFGYLSSILRLAKEHNSNQFVHTWDSPSSNRIKIYSMYKEKRRTGADKTDEEKEYDSLAKEQFDLLRTEVLPAIGFKNNFQFKGFEGDDIIASIIDNSDENQKIIMVTGDEDMFQCLCPGVVMQRKKGLYTDKDFAKEYGIGPEMWASVKAIAGCDTDEVPGIKGVGEATAIKYLTGELKVSAKGYQNIISQEGKTIIARNRQLVTLPLKGTPIPTIEKDTLLSLTAFCDICAKYSFNHFLKKEELSKWKQYLQLR